MAPSARRPRSGVARLRAVEHLEDRLTPNTTAHSLATVTYNQDWSSPGSYQSDWSASTQTSAQGFIGANLSPATVGNAGTVTADASDQFLDLNGALVAATNYGTTGVALFHPVQTGNNPTVALKPDANSSPFLLFNLNTINVADVFVDFRLRDIDDSANAAVQTVALQWRSGNADPFTTVGALIPDGTNGADIFVQRRLPVGASGLPLVQVRIITTTPAAGPPAEWIGVDDITIRGNKGPTVTPSGATPTYQEPVSPQLTGSILVDTGMTVTDSDQAVFFDNVAAVGGTLTVSVTTNAGPTDVVTIRNQGTGGGLIGFPAPGVNAPVTFGGTTIGLVNGAGTQTMTITFNGAATVDGVASTPTAIRQLVRNILFQNSSDTPGNLPRSIRFDFTDGRGGTANATTQIIVQDRNDPPTMLIGAALTTLEEQPIAVTGITVADVEADFPAIDLPLRLSATVQNTLSGVTPRTLTFTASAGVTVDTSVPGTITLTGTAAALNNAVAAGRLVFTPIPNYNTDQEAAVTIALVLSDLGNTGQLSDQNPGAPAPGPHPQIISNTLRINITPVNDPPLVNPVGVATTLAAPSTVLNLTLGAAPPAGSLVLADVLGVTGPGGAVVSLTGAVLGGSGTTYTLTFPSPLPVGTYTTALRAATQPLFYPLSSPAPVVLVAPFATVREVDFPKDGDLRGTQGGGSLTVQVFVGGVAAGDKFLRVRTEGSNPGQISTTGQSPDTSVIYAPIGGGAPITIGQIIGTGTGTATLPLIINFTTGSAVTPEIVQAVLRNITYSTSGFDLAPRTIEFTLKDGDGFNQNLASIGPNIPYVTTVLNLVQQPVNNAPSFTLPTPAVTVLEDAPGVRTVPGFAANISPGPASYESTQVVTFTVTGGAGLFAVGGEPAINRMTGDLAYTLAPNVNTASPVTLTVTLSDNGGVANGGDDTSDAQTFTISITPVNDEPSFTAADPPAVGEDAGTVTVAPWATFTAGPADEASQTATYLVSNVTNPGLFAPGGAPVVNPAGELTYTLAANASGSATFDVRVMDNGLTANGGDDTSGVQTFTITVNASNDAPTVGGLPLTTAYLISTPPQSPVRIAPAGTVADADNPANLNGGVLTVSGAAADDTLAVAIVGSVTLSGATVRVGGVDVGTVSGGTGGTPLTVQFDTANATLAAVEAVLRAVVFSTTAGTTDRTLSVTLSDAMATGPAATTTVRVADQVTVQSLVKADPSAATRGLTPLTWVLTADLPVSGFTDANFTLTGSLAGSVTAPLSFNQTSDRTVEISATLPAGAGSGTLGLDFDDEAGLSVGVTNVPPASSGGVYTIDRTGPVVQSAPTSEFDGTLALNQTFFYAVTFAADALTGSVDVDAGTVGTDDFVNFGTAALTIDSVNPTGVPGQFVVAVHPTSGGTVRLRVPAGAVLDTLGNGGAEFTDTFVLTVDDSFPTVGTITNAPSTTAPNVISPTTTVTFTVTFSEDIDLTRGTPSFTNVGTAAVAFGAVTETTPGVVTVQVTPATTTTTGTIVLRVAGVADVPGNVMTGFADSGTVIVNLPPLPVNDVYPRVGDPALTEDPALAYVVSAANGVRANDSDPNNLVTDLQVSLVTNATKGTLTLNPDGSFSYFPNTNVSGADTFTYRLTDPHNGVSTIATVTLNVAPVNDPPTYDVVVPLVTVFEDSGPLPSTTVLTNILPGPTGETEAINPVVVTNNRPGLFSVQPAITRVTVGGVLTGVLTFTPAPNQFGSATVTVKVSDAGTGANETTKTFVIVVNPVNDAPSFVLSGNPPVSAEDGGPQTVPGLVGTFNPGPNEAGLGQTAVYTVTVTSTTGGLTFTQAPAIAPDGSLTYQAAPDATGTATVRVALADTGGTANGGRDTAALTQSFVIVVRSQNDLPVAAPDAGLVPKDSAPTFVEVLSNDSPDPDGSEVLTVVSVTQPANGTASVAPGGRGVLYQPRPGFTGTDTFTYTINDGNGGPATATVTVTVRPVPAGQPLFDIIAVGTGPGGGPIVRVNSLSTGAFTGTYAAYDPSFRGGVNVAVGDVNGDNVPDIVVTPGVGGGPHVKIVDGAKLGLVDETGAISEAAVLASFFAYDPAFRGGVTVTVADVDGDGKADIITGTGPGGGAHVKVISGARLGTTANLRDGQVNPGTLLASFFAYDSAFRGGVNVAAGDVDGDGRADIITASGAGGGSHVKVFNGLGGLPLLRSFFAYGAAFRGGVNVAAGDVNGDGLADIITGAGVGGGPHVKVFDSTGAELASFFGLTGSAAGADVAYRVTKEAVPLVVGGGQRGGSQVRTYAAPDFAPYNGFDAFEPTFLGGVEVG